MKEINWQRGNFSGKGSGILFLLATQGADTINFEIRLRAFNRITQQFSWEKTDLNDSNDENLQILAYIPLTQALEWATGTGEFPHVIDTKIRTLLAWEEGYTKDTNQSYIVSLASQFDMQHYVDGEWLHPHQSEMNNGYSKFIPTTKFIQYIRTYLPFK